MTAINLLPWREEQRELKKNQFIASIIACALLVSLMMISVYLYFNHQLSAQQYRNALLKAEIRLYDKQIKEIRQLKQVRQELIARMGIIQQLQENRPLIVHFFDEIVKMIPREVYLLKLVRHGERLTIFGLAQSNTMISDLMRKLEKNVWIRKPLLNEIKKSEKNKAVGNEFRLKTLLKKSGDPRSNDDGN